MLLGLSPDLAPRPSRLHRLATPSGTLVTLAHYVMGMSASCLAFCDHADLRPIVFIVAFAVIGETLAGRLFYQAAWTVLTKTEPRANSTSAASLTGSFFKAWRHALAARQPVDATCS